MHAIALAAQDLTGVLGRPSQHDLSAARQMQAMSFAFHIPLVCFGIAFPAMVLFVEGLWLRTGDATYRDLARRWSKALAVLFAVGVVTGTICRSSSGCSGRLSWRCSGRCSGSRSRSRASRSS